MFINQLRRTLSINIEDFSFVFINANYVTNSAACLAAFGEKSNASALERAI